MGYQLKMANGLPGIKICGNNIIANFNLGAQLRACDESVLAFEEMFIRNFIIVRNGSNNASFDGLASITLPEETTSSYWILYSVLPEKITVAWKG